MRLQVNTTLALYSVIEFATDPERHIPAAEIADRYGVSPHHLAKVLAELARAGIVESVRGVGGGYRFTANARRLTLMDIIQLFEDLRAAQQPEAQRRADAGRPGAGHRAGRDRPDRQGDLQLDHAGDDAAAGGAAEAVSGAGAARIRADCSHFFP